jgi:hypothetical protein
LNCLTHLRNAVQAAGRSCLPHVGAVALLLLASIFVFAPSAPGVIASEAVIADALVLNTSPVNDHNMPNLVINRPSPDGTVDQIVAKDLPKPPIWAFDDISFQNQSDAARAAGDDALADSKASLAAAFKDELQPADMKFRQMLRIMYGTGYPPFVEAIEDFLSINGIDAAVQAGNISLTTYVRLNVSSDPKQVSQDHIFAVAPGRLDNKLGVDLYVVNKLAQPEKANQIEPMLDFLTVAYEIKAARNIATEVGNKGGSSEAAVDAIYGNAPKIRQEGRIATEAIDKYIKDNSLGRQWGFARRATPGNQVAPEAPQGTEIPEGI